MNEKLWRYQLLIDGIKDLLFILDLIFVMIVFCPGIDSLQFVWNDRQVIENQDIEIELGDLNNVSI